MNEQEINKSVFNGGVATMERIDQILKVIFEAKIEKAYNEWAMSLNSLLNEISSCVIIKTKERKEIRNKLMNVIRLNSQSLRIKKYIVYAELDNIEFDLRQFARIKGLTTKTIKDSNTKEVASV